MRGCARCVEIEQLLESTALEHWKVVHQYGGVLDSEQGATIEQLLLETKAAMDDAREQYKQHLETVHSAASSVE